MALRLLIMTEFQGWLLLAMLAVIAGTIAQTSGLDGLMWIMTLGGVGFLSVGLATELLR